MLKWTAHISLSGDAFSPFRAEQDTGLQFSEMTEPREGARMGGRRAGVAVRGSARLDPPKRFRATTGLNWLLQKLSRFAPTLRLHGATEIVLHLQIETLGSGHLELAVDQFQRLTEQEIPLRIRCRVGSRRSKRS